MMALSSVIRSELSDRELSLLAAAFACLPKTDRNVRCLLTIRIVFLFMPPHVHITNRWGARQIDMEKFTQIAGYGSVNSARVCFQPVVKKLDAIVENGGAGSVCDGDPSAPPTAAAKAPRAPKAKKSSDAAAKPATKTKGRPKKGKRGEEPAASPCFAGVADVAGAATAGLAGACFSFAAPGSGSGGLAVDASGSASTYTGTFPGASRLVPAPGSTRAKDPGNDDDAAAEQPASKKPKAAAHAAGPSIKTEEDDSALDSALARQLARGAAPRTEADDASSISEGGVRLGLGADVLPASVETAEAAWTEVEDAIPFQDQRFSYEDSLDFGFEEHAGLEDAI